MNRATLRLLITTLAVLMALFGLPNSATAAELHESPATARAGAEPLKAPEAKHVTKYLLRNLLGPVVSSDAEPPSMIAASKCRVRGTHGTCRGAVTGGVVTCRGTFVVFKFPKGYTVYPKRMICTTDQ